MPSFRDKTPKHRPDRAVCQHYTSYKGTLRVDFNHRCGYCNGWDGIRIRHYTIDHFVPRNPDGWINPIPPNRYKNLIYSCSFCNGYKKNIWPTEKPYKHNDGKIGFIKPTSYSYGRLFERDSNGAIKPKSSSSIGKYIHEKLHLGWDLHSLNWRMEKFIAQEAELEKLQKTVTDPTIKKEIEKIKTLRCEIFDIRNQLVNG
ncbi:MAG TPA: HNH endonuclease signature motif containing protein [Bacteroidia bacterium]|jgi:hypothetical protein|nr:HNH endonuclease signature motif containing protein [Bacteroidia bacterium]